MKAFVFDNAGSTMKCDTWESRKEYAILSGYGKTICSFKPGRERSNYPVVVCGRGRKQVR